MNRHRSKRVGENKLLIFGFLIVLFGVIFFGKTLQEKQTSTVTNQLTIADSIRNLPETPSDFKTDLTQEEIDKIASDAFIYLYPLVTMDLTRRQQTLSKKGSRPGVGPVNKFSHLRSYPRQAFKDVVRPNFDTLYSSAWLDLSAGPLVITIPDSKDRYYVLPFYDMHTNAFATTGTQTTGNQQQEIFITSSSYSGNVPTGMIHIKSPTLSAWVIGRTQTNGFMDYDSVHKFQDGMKIERFNSTTELQIAKNSAKLFQSEEDLTTPPLNILNEMDGETFFLYAMNLLKIYPPQASDSDILLRMKKIGLSIDENLNFDNLSEDIQIALFDAPDMSLMRMKSELPNIARLINGWQMNIDSMGVYGNNYIKRAIITMVGLGALPCENAVYPLNIMDSNGQALDGKNSYVMHFEKSDIPPVDAFWSITMYDEEGFAVANPLNRYVLGSRDNLKYNEDGSLDLYIQAESPGDDRISNWLPSASDGRLGITMRLYSPQQAVLNGEWNPPAVNRVNYDIVSSSNK